MTVSLRVLTPGSGGVHRVPVSRVGVASVAWLAVSTVVRPQLRQRLSERLQAGLRIRVSTAARAWHDSHEVVWKLHLRKKGAPVVSVRTAATLVVPREPRSWRPL